MFQPHWGARKVNDRLYVERLSLLRLSAAMQICATSVNDHSSVKMLAKCLCVRGVIDTIASPEGEVIN